VSSIDIINALLAANVDPNPELNMHRPSRGGNSGRFVEEFLNTGCTPLMRAAMGNDIEVTRALLAKGANPNIVGMGLTPFLVAAGVGTGGRGTGLAASTSAGGAANLELMAMLVEHGADVNVQVTGTQTYSMRISRAPSSTEGMTALHVAAQSGRADLVKFLLDKGAKTDIVDGNGHKPIELIGVAPAGRGGATPAAAPATAQLAVAPPAAGGRGARAGGGADPANAAEIRSLLGNPVSGR
jgi:ankyrin repeat protein